VCQPYKPAAPLPAAKIPGTHFCQRLSQTQGRIVTGRVRAIEKSNDQNKAMDNEKTYN
jgi:hypothetical protein